MDATKNLIATGSVNSDSCILEFPELKNIRGKVEGKISICPNPHCHCHSLEIKVKGEKHSNEAPKEIFASLNLETQKSSLNDFGSSDDYEVSEFLANNFSESDWLALKKYFVAQKTKIGENYDAEKWERGLHFPYQQIELSSQLTGWNDIFPHEALFSFTYPESGEKYLVEESYCLNPAHPCTSIYLVFVPEESINDPLIRSPCTVMKATESVISVDYQKTNELEVINYSDDPAAPNPKKIAKAFFDEVKEAPRIFKLRHARLSQLYNKSRTFHHSFRPSPIVRTSPKIGRNDPCPCKSGKKYKKCCLGKLSPV